MNSKLESWWVRECGGRKVFRLALPLVLSTASWAVMHFFDRMMLTWHSATEVAATLASGTMFWTVIALPLGIASYVNAFVAQYHGANRPRQIGVAIRHGIGFGWLTVPLFLLFIPVAAPWFRWMGHAPDLVRDEALYFEINCWGAGAAIISAAYAAFFTGRGETMIVMKIDVAAAAFDAVFNYLLIFGKCGLPEMGLAGAAWTTVFSQWLKVAVFWWLLRAPILRETYGLNEPLRFHRPLAERLLKFGVPSGFQMQLEGLAFAVFVLFIGQLGTVPTAATTLALSINIVAFVPMIGIGIATSTLVGQHLGGNQPQLAERAVWTGLWLALAYNAVFALLYIVTPSLFTLAHAAGTSPDEFDQIRDLSIVLLRFVAAYCLFDAAQLLFCSAIKGAGDTRFVLWTTLITSFGSMGIGQLGVWIHGGGLLWWWTVLMLWIVSLATVYCWRFLQGKWQSMRVIEPEPLELQSPQFPSAEIARVRSS